MANQRDIFVEIRFMLCGRRGPGQAITIGQMAAALGVDRRQVEHCLETRFSDFGFALVSDTTHGYFRPTKAEQLNHYHNTCRSRIACNQHRIGVSSLEARREGWREENGIWLDNPDPDLFQHAAAVAGATPPVSEGSGP